MFCICLLCFRLLVGVILTVVIYLTPYFLSQSGILLIAYKSCLVFVYFLQQVNIHIYRTTYLFV